MINERFADLFNAVIFQGEQVIKPEDLTERDTDMSGIIQFKDYQETLERTCDVVKKMAYGVEFAVLGIESQQKSIMQCHCELCCMTLWDI